MDNLEIDGENYISAKRAASENSYTADYIGQLIRGGKLVGKKVGRSWYVQESSLKAYLEERMQEGSVHVVSTTDAVSKVPSEGNTEVTESPTDISVMPVDAEVQKESEGKTESAPEVSKEDDYQLMTYVAEEGSSSLPELEKQDDTKDEPLSSEEVIEKVQEEFPQKPEPIHNSIVEEEVSVAIRQVRKSEIGGQKMSATDDTFSGGGAKTRVPRRKSWSFSFPLLTGAIATIAIVVILVVVSMSLTKVVHYDGNASSVNLGISNIRDTK